MDAERKSSSVMVTDISSGNRSYIVTVVRIVTTGVNVVCVVDVTKSISYICIQVQIGYHILQTSPLRKCSPIYNAPESMNITVVDSHVKAFLTHDGRGPV